MPDDLGPEMLSIMKVAQSFIAILMGVYFLGLLGTAHADRRNQPFQPARKAADLSPYLLKLTLTGHYQGASGQIIDSNDPEPEMETTETDLEDDLGLEKDVGFGFNAELEHQNPYLPNLRVDYSPMLFSGEHNLSKNLRIDGMSYRAGQRVKTRLEAISWDVTLLYHPVATGNARRPGFRVGLGAVVRSTQALLNVQGVGIWRVASERYDVPVLPMGFISMEVTPYRLFSWMVEGKGITDGTSQWWDVRTEVRTSPFGPMSWIGLGVRWQQLKVSQEDEGGLDTTVMGSLASIGLRF